MYGPRVCWRAMRTEINSIAIAIRIGLAAIFLLAIIEVIVLHAVVLVHQAEPTLFSLGIGSGADIDAHNLEIFVGNIKFGCITRSPGTPAFARLALGADLEIDRGCFRAIRADLDPPSGLGRGRKLRDCGAGAGPDDPASTSSLLTGTFQRELRVHVA